mgnify:CR=1 FL=1
MTNFPLATATLGGPIFTAQFVLSVGFSRVYFHCHYMGDVIAGILVGIFLCAFIAKLGVKESIKTTFLAMGLDRQEEENLYGDEF